MKSDFEKFAAGKCGVKSLTLSGYRKLVSQSVPAVSAAVRSSASARGASRNAYINPTIIEERQLNVATMDVFSRLMMDRIIFLGVPINDDVANIIQAQLLYLDSADSASDIQLYINSPGGAVYAGWGIYDTMNLVHSQVATICTGMAASMAAILLAAGVKGKRSALPHSRIMIHQPMGGAEGQAADIEIEAREIVKTRKELYESLALNTGKSIKQIEKDADRDYWMTSTEAKEYGMIDEILGKDNKGKK
ncbi:MAG: ATP-dependent Clp protease proteolytic subunit [Bacteroidales bacterium]|jgi:ATP-dependent Clp protease, protease subunit|nr:ATP-dependent Clp protease proteolytic subunit [Bacteroidales bacterium]MCI1733313.1 ATP-dependent Clp protease proteolytic subunit [Bacteroidales bacterium]